MALTLYGFRDRAHDFAVTKVGAALAECAFILDFTRPLERVRWLGVTNRWLGITVAFAVPVVHAGEDKGGYVVGVHRSEPYFPDIPKLWRKHRGARRTIRAEPADGLQIVADFSRHFPEDCRPS